MIMAKFKNRIRFDELFVIDPIGKSGGLAVIWTNNIKVEKILCTLFTIGLLLYENNLNDT